MADRGRNGGYSNAAIDRDRRDRDRGYGRDRKDNDDYRGGGGVPLTVPYRHNSGGDDGGASRGHQPLSSGAGVASPPPYGRQYERQHYRSERDSYGDRRDHRYRDEFRGDDGGDRGGGVYNRGRYGDRDRNHDGRARSRSDIDTRHYDDERQQRQYHRHHQQQQRMPQKEEEGTGSHAMRSESSGGVATVGTENEGGKGRGKFVLTTTTTTDPLSLEELLAKRKRQEEREARPVFLTKAQRQEAALKRRQKAAEEQRAHAEQLRSQHRGTVVGAGAIRGTNRNGGGGGGGGGSDGDSFWRRGRDEHRRSSTSGETSSSSVTASSSIQSEGERKAIRERYFGRQPEKRSIRRLNQRKFNFDWAEKDDTSVDYNPLYTQRHQAQFYGRGRLAGIDEGVQKRSASSFYESLANERRTQADRDREAARAIKAQAREARSRGDTRHWSTKPLADMATRDWRIMREDFNIVMRGANIPNPLRSWGESGLHAEILQQMSRLGFSEPTPVQRAAVPIGMQNRDIIGVAETGSGKTLAFVLPLLQWILSLPKLERKADIDNGPYAIILAPTRELAQQIEEETCKFADTVGIRTVTVIGGASREEQIMKLRRGCEIVIATPGRLVDVLDNRYLVLNQCSYVVMDEADRMLDMGFEEEVNAILGFMPVSNLKPMTDDEASNEEGAAATAATAATAAAAAAAAAATTEDGDGGGRLSTKIKYRQTVLFTATLPPAVERLARAYLRRPAMVQIGRVGQPGERVEQVVHMVKEQQKTAELLKVLNQARDPPPIIVFVNLKKVADTLATQLDRKGLRAVALHGGKQQDAREHALGALKSGAKDILVATDVAGRGIDIADVSLVVNYDMAKNIKEYTHRIGRTGRAGKSGRAVTLLTEEDSKVFWDLRQMLEASPISQCPQALLKHKEAQYRPGTALNKYGRVETLDLD